MARITIQDCLKVINNRFQIIDVASKRARSLMDGAEPKVRKDNDKHTVIALREIAEGFVGLDGIKFDGQESEDCHDEEN
ncbi:MAG TPA: DNA-directed RNA polymerase subunit omega [Gammaproteobacteria bacterium]|nr:DNA-directed RNA polymerase subunit omega [Gammaproteobacteria bacterium]